MTALERTTIRGLLHALAITLGGTALACGDQKPRAQPSAPPAPAASQLTTAPAFSMAGASPSDSTVLRLATATDSAPAGTSVRIPVAHVESVMSARGFWIGVWGQEVYVFQTAPTPIPVQGGEAYTVIGTVRVAPHAMQGAPRGMTPIDIEALHAQHIYIAADSVARTER